MSGAQGGGNGNAGGNAGGASGAAGEGGAGAAQGAAAGSAGASGAGASGGAGASAGGSSDWTSGLDELTRGFVQNKGWKGPADVLTSYQNLEKLHGVPAEQIIKLPTKADDVEAWNGIYDRLGRPKEAKDYKIEAPKEGGDPKFVEWAKTTFHGLGFTDKQAVGLAAKWNEHISGAQAAQLEAQKTKNAEEGAALQKEWGAAYDQKSKQADAAMRVLGLKPEMMVAFNQAVGFSAAMKALADIGAKVGEDSFVGGGGAPSANSQEGAKSKLDALKSDGAFMSRYLNGDAAAKDELEKLMQVAFPGEMAI